MGGDLLRQEIFANLTNLDLLPAEIFAIFENYIHNKKCTQNNMDLNIVPSKNGKKLKE